MAFIFLNDLLIHKTNILKSEIKKTDNLENVHILTSILKGFILDK